MTIEQAVVRAFQGNIPLEPAPFKKIAARLGMPEGKLLGAVGRLKRRGVLRSIRAIVRHRRAGYVSAMVVWRVPESRVLFFGRTAAASSSISHCCLRPRRTRWPYNVYTMAHGKSRGEILKTVERLEKKTGVKEFKILESLREFKKTSMVYY